MKEIEGLLIVADGRDAASWNQGRALAAQWTRAKKNVLLRDGTGLAIALDFFDASQAVADEGVRHLLRIEYHTFFQHFHLDSVVCLPPLPPKVAGFFGSIANYRLLPASDFLPGLAAVPASDTPAPNGSPTGPNALIPTNDMASCASKTSGWLAEACEELGGTARVEDTNPFRIVSLLTGDLARPDKVAELEEKTHLHLKSLVDDTGADTVLALDLNWFLDHDSLLGLDRIKRVVSFWYDDVKAWCQAPYNTCLPESIGRLQAALRHPKVIHCCYGQGLLDEMRQLGYANVRLSHLAAPTAYLRHHAPPQITDRAAFIGNPGANVPPRSPLMALMERGAELEEVRAYARECALAFVKGHFGALIQKEPTVLKWFTLALESKALYPYSSSSHLLQAAGTHYPRALEAVNESGEILNALTAIKMANQYDRAALIHRLHRAGLLDVYSHPQEWAPFGIEARPDVGFPDLPSVYQRYSCHLNGYNSSRDATANEKLFEIAACGRVSVNLSSPDVRECYEEGEIALASSFGEAEERVRHFLAHPDEALDFGRRARRRTKQNHLWSHRLRAFFPPPSAAPAPSAS